MVVPSFLEGKLFPGNNALQGCHQMYFIVFCLYLHPIRNYDVWPGEINSMIIALCNKENRCLHVRHVVQQRLIAKGTTHEKVYRIFSVVTSLSCQFPFCCRFYENNQAIVETITRTYSIQETLIRSFLRILMNRNCSSARITVSRTNDMNIRHEN